MANYRVSGESLNAVADAIRSRAGTEDALVFPDGFVSAVEGIPDYLAQVLNKTITNYYSAEVTSTPAQVLRDQTSLVSITMPNCTILEYVILRGCTALKYVDCPSVWRVQQEAFALCSALEKVDLPMLRYISAKSFQNCTSLSVFIICKPEVITLNNVDAFSGTPIESGTGYIYVPKALENSYKSATNWSTYASQIRAIEDYPEITGG